MKSKKGKCKSCLDKCRWPRSRYAYIVTIFLLLPLISLPSVLAESADPSSKWDQPFGKPQYLLHATGHGTVNGPMKDDWWFLNENQPKSGFIELPDGMGGTFTYSIDQTMGPFNTPREVCAAAGGKTGDGSIAGFNCKEITTAAGATNTNKPEEGPCANACDKSRHLVWDGYAGCSCICEDGWKFDEYGNCEPAEISEMEEEIAIDLETPGGTKVIKPGERIEFSFLSGDVDVAKVRAICKGIEADVASFNSLALTTGDVLVDRDTVVGLTLTYILLDCAKLRENDEVGKVFEDDSSSSGSPGDLPIKLELSLQRGPLGIDVSRDDVAMDVNTPTAFVSSAGKNRFGVAYNPATGRTTVAALQYPVSVRPASGSQAPLTLAAGQQVEVSSEGVGPITPLSQTSGWTEGSTYVSPDGKDIYGTIGGTGSNPGNTGATFGTSQGGCYTDPSTGQMICGEKISDFFNPEAGNQEKGGCYTDPETGQTICIDTFDDFTNPSSNTGSNIGTAYTMQPDAGSSVPQSLHECETYTSEICGTWTRMGDQFNAKWDNGASATLYVERWDNGAVVLTRQDTVGSSAGLTARYEGRCTGNHVEGMVTWTWNGSTWSGTWSANW